MLKMKTIVTSMFRENGGRACDLLTVNQGTKETSVMKIFIMNGLTYIMLNVINLGTELYCLEIDIHRFHHLHLEILNARLMWIMIKLEKTNGDFRYQCGMQLNLVLFYTKDLKWEIEKKKRLIFSTFSFMIYHIWLFLIN